jgi:Cd2+/Zn2+-exporting ATPase
MALDSTVLQNCPDCRVQKQTFFVRYRDFLLSRDTLLTFGNALLLIAGFVVTNIFGQLAPGKMLYLASALLGGIPLFIFTARQVFIRHDITAGVMASVAVIAAIIVKEYSAAALVVFMMSVGEWLENFTIARADNALKDLASLIPSTITVRRDGNEIVIPIDQLKLDETVLVHAGERFGVDGIISRGTSCVNQSAITGESIPVDKNPGDEVFAGTMNDMGVVEVKVSRLGENTTLGQIVKLVKDAQASQAPVQRIANQYARILVPVTFVIAILVYVFTRDVIRSITVLVVVCPCALVLATPTAVVAAIGNAAKKGILVKAGSSIEMAGKVDVVALDKTGTLTIGKPIVQDVISLNGIDGDALLKLAGSVERFSEHPIGKAIVEACNNKSISLEEPTDFKVQPGFGVQANTSKGKMVVGTRSLLMENGFAWTESMENQMQQLEKSGQIVITVGLNNNVAGFISLVDQPRPEAKRAVDELKKMGIKQVIMITGDNPFSAARTAKEMGIDRFYSQVLPQDKLKIIRDLQAEGHKVMFAGDGVNDAPALAAADIGVAMGMGGTDVALETAEIGLMADEIERLPQIIGLSRKALKVIRANVIFSMSVNLISVFLGSFGVIGPVIGALIHEGSSVPVLANSARLVNYKLDGR